MGKPREQQANPVNSHYKDPYVLRTSLRHRLGDSNPMQNAKLSDAKLCCISSFLVIDSTKMGTEADGKIKEKVETLLAKARGRVGFIVANKLDEGDWLESGGGGPEKLVELVADRFKDVPREVT